MNDPTPLPTDRETPRRRPAALWLASGVVIGVLGLGLIRFAILPPLEHVHYHANWALWLNGEPVDFSADQYMEDVSACFAEGAEIQAAQRVHLHGNEPHVAHIHHTGVTWGHLLQNLGWAIGPDWILTDQFELYRTGDGKRLTYIVNGIVALPANDRLIEPGDRLLISFGTESAEQLLSERFPTVASDAPVYDATYDPAGCAGRAEETPMERLARAFWL